MAASILTDEKVTLNNVPDLMDIATMKELLTLLGKKVSGQDGSVIIEETDPVPFEAPYDICRKMRASIAVMGPLLARKKKAKISFPGGCAIGPRPIDLHITGMKNLGADLRIEHGYIWAQAGELTGKKINLLGNSGPSVGATENVMSAAVLARGITVIEGAACEPEIEDLAVFLTGMGAKIKGAGTTTIIIEGVERLHGTVHEIIPDRIETGTFIAAAGITGGEIHLRKVNAAHLEKPIEILSLAGVEIEILSNDHIIARGNTIKPVEVDTRPYPYFPTDLQAQLMALLCVSEGISIITEKIFPDRFMHAAELCRMGADIKVDGAIAVIKGVPLLSGASVMASDLRAGAGLVVGALRAHGQSEILRIYHLDRGYERLEEKLKYLGADIERLPQ
jgi:UDP-N-acetylglucosamine 1-carboxyvinyltransferase